MQRTRGGENAREERKNGAIPATVCKIRSQQPSASPRAIPHPSAASGVKKPQRRRLGFWELVAKGGIEPPTQGFSVLCSTD